MPEESAHTTTCKNCDTEFMGNYCPNCSQKAYTSRINLHFILYQIKSSLFLSVSKGLTYTIRELFFRPGETMRAYLAGKRIKHFKPITFVLLLSIVYTLLLYFMGSSTYIQEFISGMTEGFRDESTDNFLYLVNILDWLVRNYAYTILLCIPLFSLGTYLSFIRSEFNYYELLLLNIYLMGEITFFLIILSPLTYFYESSFTLVYVKGIIVIAYTFIAYLQFFNGLKRISRILDTLLTFLLFIVLLLITIFILLFITTVIGLV